MKKLNSNQYRCKAMDPESISAEINRARGYHHDPCDILIRLEDRAEALYEARVPPTYDDDDDRVFFIRAWVGLKIDEL